MTAAGQGSELGTVITAILTPFKPDGAVDFKSFKTLARHLVENGSDGLVVSGSTGESPTLSDREKLMLYFAAAEEVGDQATVIAGTGTYDTHHSAYLTRQAAEFVDAFLVVTPYYSKPPQRGIVEHFARVAEATDKPMIVYNIPSRVIVNIEPETLAEIGEIENIVAVKQANTDLDQARRIVEETPLLLYAGDDAMLLPFLELGAAGGILVYSHFAGGRVRDLVTRFRAGDREGAKRIDEELRPLLDAISVTTNPISTKAMATLTGLLEHGTLRLPLVDATAEEVERMRALLGQAGLLEPVEV
ncbi:MAG: 4-hydroxy-tetrahydrodipicolinate synthase [Gaiellaceae bacterium]